VKEGRGTAAVRNEPDELERLRRRGAAS